MHSAPAASGTGSQRQANRRLAGGLLLSLLFHGLVLSLQFGIPIISPRLTRPLTVSIAVPEPLPLPAPGEAPLPAPASAAAPTPERPHSGAPGTGMTLVDPVPPTVAPVAKPPARQARRVRTRRVGMPLLLPPTDRAQVRVIAQDRNPDASFKVPLPQPGDAAPLAPDQLQAQDGGEQGAGDASAGMIGESESPEVADEAALLLAQRLAEEKSQADQAVRRAAADLQRQRQEAEASLALQQRVAEDQARVVAEHKAAEDQREYLAQQRLAAEAEARARVQAQQVADEQASAQAQRVAGEQARAEAQRVAAAERGEMQRRAGEIAAALAARKLAEEDARQQALVGERLELAARQQAEELARTRQAALEAARRQDEEMALRQREEQRARQEAGQLAARQQADELARQQAGQMAALRQADAGAARQQAQEAAHRQRAEQLAQQLAEQAAARAKAEEAERQLAEQVAARAKAAEAAEAERQQALPPAPQLAQRSGPEPDSGVPGVGTGNAASAPGAGRVTIPKNMLGSDLANRARDMVRGIDILRGIPPAVRPAQDELRARRRAVVDAVERDVPLRMYVDSVRQKIERNAAIIAHRLAPDRVRRDPLVSVALRSDGSVEDVTIVRSSGRAETDEAVRHIVRINARYSAFPPNVAARYDVVEIRRIWTFAEGLKLLEEVR